VRRPADLKGIGAGDQRYANLKVGGEGGGNGEAAPGWAFGGAAGAVDSNTRLGSEPSDGTICFRL